ISVGLLAGALASALVVIIAWAFGGDLRPSLEITGDLIASEIIITVPTAFFEELAYRGYLMPRMAKLWGRGKGIIISSLFFSLLHFAWWAPLGSVPIHLVILFTFNIMLGGIVLSLSYFMSGEKLWVPIGFHFSWNMIAYILFPTYPRVSVNLPEIFQIEWGITTILGFLFGLSVLWIFLQQKKKE
ncbi:MAG: CPBP family intramembrane glutamic endopeptidase, partial [Candidatus Thorarchaeota archaeon]